MADLARNDETGEFAFRDDWSGEWRKITAEQAELIRSGEAGGVGTGIGAAITDALAEGARSLVAGPGATFMGPEQRAGMERLGGPIGWLHRQGDAAAGAVEEVLKDPAARGAAQAMNPLEYGAGYGAGLAGSAFAPGLAGRAAVGGGRAALSAAERVAGGVHEAGVRARLGRAAREAEAMPAPGGQRVAGENPNVFAPEARFADALDNVRGAPGSVRGTQPAEVEEAARQGLAARLFKWGEPDPPPPRVIKTAERLGFKLSPGGRSGRRGQRLAESAMKSNPASAGAFDRVIGGPNQKRMNELYADAIGLPRNKHGDLPDAVTPELLGQAVDIAEGTFERAAKEAGEIAIPPEALDRMRKRAMDEIDFLDDRKRVQDLINNIPTKARGDQVLNRITRWRKEAAGLRRSGGNEAVADALDNMADVLEDGFVKAVKPSTRKAVQEARENWRMIRLGEKGRALDEVGDVSANGMAGNARTGQYTAGAYRRGRGMKTKRAQDFVDGLRTMQHFRELVGNSGTATRGFDFMNPASYLSAAKAEAYLGNYGRAAREAGVGLGSNAALAGSGIGGFSGLLGD